MKSKIIAFITASAIATAGLSAPVKADERFVQFLVGAAVLGAIASAANNGNPRVTVRTNQHHYRPHNVNPRPHRQQRYRQHTHVQQKPRQCLRQKWTNNGRKTFYAPNCMRQMGWHRHSGAGWHIAGH
jgi:hypothetical protein